MIKFKIYDILLMMIYNSLRINLTLKLTKNKKKLKSVIPLDLKKKKKKAIPQQFYILTQ